MKRLLMLLVLVIMLSIPSEARADMAPPGHPPGSNPQPDSDSTQVRMVAEKVLINVLPGASDKSLGQAHVTANFTMHNLGSADESMAARFPIGSSDGYFKVNELSDLQIKVNGTRVSTRRVQGEDPYRGSDPVPWAEFDITFPAGQDTPVEVQYTLQASGEYPFIWYKYILSSGAGWKDTIGSADIIVQLPYEANIENLMLDSPGISFGTTASGTLDGNAIRWHYTNLEPSTQDNFEVNLVTPSAWQHLLDEQSNLAKNPDDGESWGRLGKLSKEMAFSSRGKGFRAGDMDPGGEELYQRSLRAYEKAVTLLPKDALWHAGYADLLSYHAHFEGFSGADTTQEAVHSMQEIELALTFSPNDAKVRQIAEQIASFFPDGMRANGNLYDYPWLTAIPTPQADTSQPTQVAEALTTVATSVSASATPQAAATPESKPSTSICGSAILMPLLLMGLTFARSRGRQSVR